MKQTSILLFFVLFITLGTVQAGQGRDGTWAKSIRTLSTIISDLKVKIEKLTDQEIQKALNGMEDREDYIHVKELNSEKFKQLVQKVLQTPDPIQLKRKLKDDDHPLKYFHYKIEENNADVFATSLYYSHPAFQKEYRKMRKKQIREIQFMILREISHLWGFGEDGAVDYASSFANKMMHILYKNIYEYSRDPSYLNISKFYKNAKFLTNDEKQTYREHFSKSRELFCTRGLFIERSKYEKKIRHITNPKTFSIPQNAKFYGNELHATPDPKVTVMIIKDPNLTGIPSYTVCHPDKKYLLDFFKQF
jgi:hypothetical protein